MDDEIVLSDELWDYYVALEQICARIQQANVLALTGSGMISDGSTYQGNAAEEMYFFMASAVGHTQKLMMLYSAAQAYLSNTFQEMYDVDQLLAWALEHL